MNPRLERLHAYPFERLARLKAGVTPPAGLAHIAMSIGEPQHVPPPFVLETLRATLDQLGSYPATAGLPEFRAACARWLERRFKLHPGSVDAGTMVLPVNGTREALFAFVQAIVDERREPLVAMPNPFYQIYEGAALLAGAEPYLLNTTAATLYTPDLDAVPESVWRRCQVLFLCSPGNPTGAVLSLSYLQQALSLAERYDFVVAGDECYTELYLDEASPPPGLLQACVALGNDKFKRCVVFHSLSKRSSVPGLRSGFVAGDPEIIKRFLLYRTYHGSAMAVPTQLASIAAWQEDGHAAGNRRLYQEKFERVLPILAPVMKVEKPAGAFYLWPEVGGDDEVFTRELFARKNLTVLPGSYLARATLGVAGGSAVSGSGAAVGVAGDKAVSGSGAAFGVAGGSAVSGGGATSSSRAASGGGAMSSSRAASGGGAMSSSPAASSGGDVAGGGAVPGGNAGWGGSAAPSSGVVSGGGPVAGKSGSSGRAAGGTVNPGAGRVRISLVAPVAQCVEAAERIRDFVLGR